MHIQRRVLLIASLFLIPILAAYVQWSIFGLPQLPAIPHVLPTTAEPQGFFWPNGKLPDSDEWKVLANEGFKNYRLKVYGLVENPVALSLDELRALGKKEQITLHNCIQGWSGIAAWGGLPMVELMKLVRPKPEAKTVVFYSFGEGLEGGQFYDSHTIENVRHCQTMLAR